MRKANNKAEALNEAFLGMVIGAYVQMNWTDEEIAALCQGILHAIRVGVADQGMMAAADVYMDKVEDVARRAR